MNRGAVSLGICEEWLNDLPQQFQGKKNITAFVKAISRQLAEVERVQEEIVSLTDIENATGINLDRVGDIVVLTRKEAAELIDMKPEDVMSDDKYRQLMKYQVLRSSNDCTYDDIMEGMKYSTDAEFDYREDEAHPATIIFEMKDDGIDKKDIYFRHDMCIHAAGVAILVSRNFYAEAAHDIHFEANALTIRGDFYPRGNLAYLLLDGSWLLDGTYELDGNKEDGEVDLYPAALGVTTEVSAEPELEVRLTVEKDLWYLDGSVLLDGSRILDAEIINYEL